MSTSTYKETNNKNIAGTGNCNSNTCSVMEKKEYEQENIYYNWKHSAV